MNRVSSRLVRGQGAVERMQLVHSSGLVKKEVQVVKTRVVKGWEKGCFVSAAVW